MPRKRKALTISPEPSSIMKMGEYPGSHATAGRGPGRPKVKSTRPSIGGIKPKTAGAAAPRARAMHARDSAVKKPKSQTMREQSKGMGHKPDQGKVHNKPHRRRLHNAK